MLRLAIPTRPVLRIEHVVMDLNGTIGDRGTLMPDVVWRVRRIAAGLQVHVLTADTHASAGHAARTLGVHVRTIASGTDKRDIVDHLGARACVAIGNGANDAAMLEHAALGIAVLGPEGTAGAALAAADIVCRSTEEALDLLLTPLALTATLRP